METATDGHQPHNIEDKGGSHSGAGRQRTGMTTRNSTYPEDNSDCASCQTAMGLGEQIVLLNKKRENGSGDGLGITWDGRQLRSRASY